MPTEISRGPAESYYTPIKRELPKWDQSQVSGAIKGVMARETKESFAKAATMQSLIDSLNGLFPPSMQNAMGGGNSRIVEAAKSFAGSKYLMGGQGKGGIDCSGLVVEAMKLAGMPIPDMTAADMQSKTPKITASEAQPGDLLIWNDGKHVEIVVSASGNQVKTIGSASSRGGVSEGNHPLAGKTIHRNTLGQAGAGNGPRQTTA